jgi:hypothetical protein
MLLKTVKNIMSGPLLWLFILNPDSLLLYFTGDDPFPGCIRILDVAEEEQTENFNSNNLCMCSASGNNAINHQVIPFLS